MNNSDSRDEAPAPAFRMNAKVLKVALITMVALALPLTLAIVGLRDMRTPADSVKALQAPEVEGLRRALETVVDNRWSAPVLDGSSRRVVKEVANGDACLEVGNRVREIAKTMDLTVVIPEKIESGGTRWLVQMPAERASAFELELGLLGFTGLGGASNQTEGTVLYEVEIPIRP